MAETEWMFPGAALGTGWSASPSGTLLDSLLLGDDIRAVHGAPATDYLICSDFGFSFSGTEVIEGIEVEAESSTPNPVPQPGGVPFLGARLSKDGVSPDTVEKEILVGFPGDATGVFGGSSDLWGISWTPAELNDSGFSVLLNEGSSSGESPSQGRRIDYVKVKVFFSDPGGLGTGMASKMRRIPDVGAIRNKTISKRVS